MQNIWQCSDYDYAKNSKAIYLPRIHPDRADKFHIYGIAGGMSFVAEHVLRGADGIIRYIAYEWIDWRGVYSAYITFELIPNDAIECGYYMRLAGVSNNDWLLKRLLYDTDGEAIGLHNPSEREGKPLWTARRTLEGIL